MSRQTPKESAKSEPGLVEAVLKGIKAMLGLDKKKSTDGLMLWKEGGSYRWAARYSNNVRDNDKPPEIISAASHKRFDAMLESKEAAMPQLWLWHNPSWKFGEATWHAYDDKGWAISGGKIDDNPAAQELAGLLESVKEIRVSHGMPISSIKRDEIDPTVIVEHETREISPLPFGVEANQFTGFAVLKENDTMTIPEEKKERLTKEWGVPLSLLNGLEAQNAADAQKAAQEGLETKDADPAPVTPQAAPAAAEAGKVDEPESEMPTDKGEETQPVPAGDPPPTYVTVSDFETFKREVVGQLQSLVKSIKDAQENEHDRVKELMAQTPAASQAAIIRSVIGIPDTKVDGRTQLAKSKPAESRPTDGKTGIPLIDNILAQSYKAPGG
jgi:hypothetical protein